LSTLAAHINDAGKGKDIRVTVVPAGNQVVMKIATTVGQHVNIAGAPDSFHSRPLPNFAARGCTPTISLDGTPVGRLTIKDGDDLRTIADAINAPGAPFTARGISASVKTIAGVSYLELVSAAGLPLGFSEPATGRAVPGLAMRLNVRDSLGLCPPATQVFSGFANFLGLNDFFVADPIDAFDSKAPTGIFTSTAVPGTARAMVLNPKMQDRPTLLENEALAGQMTEILRGQVNVGAAGGLARGSHNLTHYAETIIATATAQGQATRGKMVFQQTLVDGLTQQHSRIDGMDMNDTVTTLTTYQRAFHDSSSVVSTITQLFGTLGAPVH
jgi:hypothetical protein